MKMMIMEMMMIIKTMMLIVTMLLVMMVINADEDGDGYSSNGGDQMVSVVRERH